MMKDGLKRLASVAFVIALFAVSAAENQVDCDTDAKFVELSKAF